jgi:hypothetical protein
MELYGLDTVGVVGTLGTPVGRIRRIRGTLARRGAKERNRNVARVKAGS